MVSNFEHPRFGRITDVAVFEQASDSPSSIIHEGQAFRITATLQIEDAGARADLNNQTEISELEADFYLESLGQGQNIHPASDKHPWKVEEHTYTFEVSVSSESLGVGVYRSVVAIKGLDEEGNALPAVWYSDGPVFQVYS